MSTAYDCVHYDRDPMRSRIYGLAVGDAIGVPYGFCERGTFECTDMVGDGTHGRHAGTWSDDTSMALCIRSSIERLAYIDAADIAGRFRRWLGQGDFACDGRVFDVGVTCGRAIPTGVPAKSYDDCGDGPLMGTAPPAMSDRIEPYGIREVSAIAHAHPAAEWPCVALCDMSPTVRNVGTPAKGDLRHGYGHIASRPVGAAESDGCCGHTPEAALRCFPNTFPYADCVPAAVNPGDDTDTTAAVAGAIAGVHYRFGAIPPKRIGRLRGKAVIDQCIWEG